MTLISATALLTVFSCGVFFALADFTRKKASLYAGPEMLIALVFTVIAPLYWVWFLLSGDRTWSAGFILPGTINILCNVLANIFFIRSVAVSPLSKTIPLLSLTPVLTALVSFGFLGEALAAAQWAGIILVVLGILFLYTPAGQPFNFLPILRNLAEEKGARFMLATALLWTFCPVADRVALRYTTVPIDGMIHFTAASIMLWVWLAARRKIVFPAREGWCVIGVLALLYAAAMATQMLALKLVFVGIIESVKRVMAQISALALGRFAFGEPVTAAKIIAVALMCAGVPLIVLSP